MAARGSYFNGVINIIKLSIGCGILALPVATFGGGSIVSPLLNAFVAGYLMVKNPEKHFDFAYMFLFYSAELRFLRDDTKM